MAHIDIIGKLNKSNQPIDISKGVLSDPRSRIPHHKKNFESTDSRLNGLLSNNQTKKIIADRNSIFIKDIGIMDKNISNKKNGYINVKTFREKSQKTKIKQQFLAAGEAKKTLSQTNNGKENL